MIGQNASFDNLTGFIKSKFEDGDHRYHFVSLIITPLGGRFSGLCGLQEMTQDNAVLLNCLPFKLRVGLASGSEPPHEPLLAIVGVLIHQRSSEVT
jgi:hypothetical protein